MARQIKPGPLFPLHVRTAQSGLMFIYLGEQKICRYIPDRQAVEFLDHHKGGRVVEASIAELAEGLVRLVEGT